MLKDFDLMGLRVKEKVTGFEGIVTSVGYDLYGCIQAVVTPPQKEPGKLEDSRWFDTKRLEKLSHKPVMEIPDFGQHPDKPVKAVQGGYEKPLPRNA